MRLDQVHRAIQKSLKVALQKEVDVVKPSALLRLEVHKKIDIALGRIKGLSDSRSHEE